MLGPIVIADGGGALHYFTLHYINLHYITNYIIAGPRAGVGRAILSAGVAQSTSRQLRQTLNHSLVGREPGEARYEPPEGQLV